MNEKGKIKLLGRLYRKYGSVKGIFRLEEDKHKGDSDLEAIDFEEWKNFILWGEGKDLFVEMSKFMNCKYNQVTLRDSVGLFLENEEEIESGRMRIESERLRLLEGALDRNERDINSISGVPCGYSHLNAPGIYGGRDVIINSHNIQGDKNKVDNGSDSMDNVGDHCIGKEDKRNFWSKHWKWIIGTSIAVIGVIISMIAL